MQNRKNQKKRNELVCFQEKQEAQQIQLAKQLLDRNDEIQRKIELKTKSDLTKTQMKSMLATFLEQLKKEFNPTQQQIPTTATPKKPKSPNHPQNKQKKRSHSPGSPLRIAPPLRTLEEMNEVMKQVPNFDT